MVKQSRIKWNRGNGEFIGLAIISAMLCIILINTIAFVQYSLSVRALSKAATTVSRAIALCETRKDAEKIAKGLVEESVFNSNLHNITTSIDVIDGDKKAWKSGQLMQVTVDANIKTIEPFFTSGRRSKSVLVTLEYVQEMNLDAGETVLFIWDYFRNKGFSEAATAGMLGNASCESDFRATCENVQSYGIFQVDKQRDDGSGYFAYARMKHSDPANVRTQSDYVYDHLNYELTTFSGRARHRYPGGGLVWWTTKVTLDSFKDMTDPEDAAEIFCACYERPFDANYAERRKRAKQYYNQLSGRYSGTATETTSLD